VAAAIESSSLLPAASPQQEPQAVVAEIAASANATPDPQALNTQQGLNPEDLNLVALSRRLGIAHQSITARRRRVDFSSWTQQRDPAGYSWTYCDASNTYRRATA